MLKNLIKYEFKATGRTLGLLYAALIDVYKRQVGGPTANFRRPSCEKQLRHGVCTHRECLYPTVCPNIEADHSEYIDILRALRSLPGVKKV